MASIGMVYSNEYDAEFYGNELAARGVMRGDTYGNLNLDNNLTRAETTAMLHRNFSEVLRAPLDSKIRFEDVDKNSWYYNDICWATNVKLVNGVDSSKFNPDGKITKEQLAVIIHNYFKTYGYEGLLEDLGATNKQVYKDAHEVSSWAKDAVEYCAEANILALDSEGKFNPTSYAKRGEFAEMLVKMNYLNDDYLSHSMWWHSRDKEVYNYTSSRPMEEFDIQGVTYRTTAYKLINSETGTTILEGMPINNIILSDIDNDGQDEICATVYMGSGIIDSRVLVYDNDRVYQLSDRGNYDYSLTLEQGELVVLKASYNTPEDTKIKGKLILSEDKLYMGELSNEQEKP